MIPVLGFAPDADPTTPGVMTACNEFMPSPAGMKTFPGYGGGIASLAAQCRGVASVALMTGFYATIAGTAAKLYGLSAGFTWTDLSAAAYSLGASDRWSFAQLGNDTLAATITQALQKWTGGAAFAAIAGAPKGQIVLSVYGFAVLLHTNEGTFGDQADRWWCSGFQDDTTWTPAVSTQCTTGRLIEGGGPFTSGVVFGDDFIVGKKRALFHARYVGPPSVWNFTRVPGTVGCSGQDAMVSIGDAVVIAGDEDIYIYDGVRARSIAEGSVRDWYRNNLNLLYTASTQVVFDRIRKLVFVFFVDTSGTTLNNVLVYSLSNGRWGRATRDVESAFYYTPLVTGTPHTYVAYFNQSHGFLTLDDTATSPDASFTTHAFGDENVSTTADKFQVRFLSAPSFATSDHSIKDVLGVHLQPATPRRSRMGISITRVNLGGISSRWRRKALANSLVIRPRP